MIDADYGDVPLYRLIAALYGLRGKYPLLMAQNVRSAV